MARTSIRFGIALIGSAVVSLAMFACSSDSKTSSSPPDGGNDAGGGKGGASGAAAGGKTGSGGTKASSGGAASTDAGNLYTCTPHAPGTTADGGVEDPAGTAVAGASCCGGFGTCSAKTALASDPAVSSYGHAECKSAGDLLCAPKPLSQLPDGGATSACHSKIGSIEAEGRCLPKCFTLGDPNANTLTAGDCKAVTGTEIVCAPCYDPITGKSTGACNRATADGGADKPAEPAVRFAECGAFPTGDAGGAKKMGLCLAKSLVAATGGASLPQDTCATGEVCVPTTKVVDTGTCFEHCASLLGPGACIPTYLVEDGAGKGFSGTLGKVTCQDNLTCTPCLSGATPTGACAS